MTTEFDCTINIDGVDFVPKDEALERESAIKNQLDQLAHFNPDGDLLLYTQKSLRLMTTTLNESNEKIEALEERNQDLIRVGQNLSNICRNLDSVCPNAFLPPGMKIVRKTVNQWENLVVTKENEGENHE